MSATAQFWVRAMLVRYTDRWETLAGDTWMIAGPEAKELIATHLGEHCSESDYPSEEADRALRGPGENEGLRLVASGANETTPAHWLARAHEVTDAINALGVSSARLTISDDCWTHWTLEISTGGWADCEFLLGEHVLGVVAAWRASCAPVRPRGWPGVGAMTEDQRDQMLHAIGGKLHGGHRNHYVSGDPSDVWEPLVSEGLATRQDRDAFGGNCYHVTAAGLERLRAEMPDDGRKAWEVKFIDGESAVARAKTRSGAKMQVVREFADIHGAAVLGVLRSVRSCTRAPWADALGRYGRDGLLTSEESTR